jgi:sorting nexin-25
MEFMDRRNRSLLVQFWLTVESFKNPLESVESDSEADNEDILQETSVSTTVNDDVAMIYELYFSGIAIHPLLASIPQKYVDSIRDYARNKIPITSGAQRKVRRSVMLAQRQVEKNMEQDFEEFERSDLWFKAVNDADFSEHRALSETPSHADVISLASTTTTPLQSPLSPRFPINPPTLPHTESAPTLASKRLSTTSRGSSNKIPATNRHQSNIDVLMGAADDSSDLQRTPLFDDPDDAIQRAEESRMRAIQAALTDIIALEDGNPTSIDGRHSRKKSTNVTKRRKGVFDDDDLEDDLEDSLDAAEHVNESHTPFKLAEPGDLQLSYEIARLAEKLANLQTQDTMLQGLIKKAELTGDMKELRLLTKSRSSLNREIREVKFQKLQYEQQDSANRLVPDRTKVAIVNSTVTEEEGRSVVRYLIEVQQLGPDGTFASGWVVARRYNEFLSMHNKLREKYGPVRNLEFPGKRLVTALSGNLVDSRKVALEKYLQV